MNTVKVSYLSTCCSLSEEDLGLDEKISTLVSIPLSCQTPYSAAKDLICEYDTYAFCPELEPDAFFEAAREATKEVDFAPINEYNQRIGKNSPFFSEYSGANCEMKAWFLVQWG